MKVFRIFKKKPLQASVAPTVSNVPTGSDVPAASDVPTAASSTPDASSHPIGAEILVQGVDPIKAE